LYPGDLIGRAAYAALRLDDPRISEAHALVSLRGADLKLLALRGVIAVDDKRVPEVVLSEGSEFALAKGLVIEVIQVEIPEMVMALDLGGVKEQMLGSGVYSLVTEPVLGLRPKFEAHAAAHIWSTGEGWRYRERDGEAEILRAGSSIEVSGHVVHVVMIPVNQASASETGVLGRLHKPMRVVANYDTVHIHRDGEASVVLNGISARIVSELVGFDGPADWEVIARQIWRDESERFLLRRKWDVNLARLRSKLRKARLRPDLVVADGLGHFEILLHPDDHMEDRT
jgi:hypothetical protein